MEIGSEMKDKLRVRDSVRIVTAIASKDILDAFKSKTIITMILAVLMLLLMSQAIPLLSKIRNVPRALFMMRGNQFCWKDSKRAKN
jgi:ABC-type Na+ efflux pump permease subunit